jgi:ferric-dicitrate binding protein FerR (iron transport regulator)
VSPACQQTPALLDGRLSGGERAAAEQHARSCESCRPQLEAWRRFSDGYLAQVPPLGKPSAEETRRMMRKARASAAPARSARPWWMVAAAAGAAVVIAVAVAVLNRAPQTVPAMAELADGQVVPLVGDTVEGAADRGALLRVGDDRVGVAAHSRVRLLRHDRERVRLRLEAGSVAASVKHRAPGQSFSVESGGFEVTVVGTRFRVERLSDGVRVDVEEGHVQVMGPGGAHFDVLAGHTLGIRGGQSKETSYAGGDFSELGEAPAAGAPAASAEVEAAVPEDVGPAAKPRSLSASELERWRREALAGHCSAVTTEIRRAVRENPPQAEAWRVLADCSRLTGDSRGAVSGYKRVISLASPEEADRARLLLAGVLHERLGNDSEAERVLRVYLATPKAPTLEAGARMTLARVLISLHRPAEAKRELQRVTRKLPASPQALEALEMLKSLDAH